MSRSRRARQVPSRPSSSSATRKSAVVASLVKNQLIADQPDDLERHRVLPDLQPHAAQRRRPGTRVRRADHSDPRHHRSTGRPRTAAPETCADPDDDFVTPTVDVAQQYDFLGGDAPARPLNGLAMTNSIMAYALLHGNVPEPHDSTKPAIIDQGTVRRHALLHDSGRHRSAPAAARDGGCSRSRLWRFPTSSCGCGSRTPISATRAPVNTCQFQLSPIGNPIGLIGNTLGAIPVGIDDTVAGFTTPGNRPLGTQPSGPFGVGGPPATRTPALDAARTSRRSGADGRQGRADHARRHQTGQGQGSGQRHRRGDDRRATRRRRSPSPSRSRSCANRSSSIRRSGRSASARTARVR